MLKINRNFATFYGIMLGDGCLSLINKKKKFISIASCIHDDLPFVEKVILPILKKLRGKETNLKFRPNIGTIELNFTDYKLFDFISSIEFPIGKKGKDIKIPKIFYEQNLIKYILRGYFATDGSLVLTNNNGILYPRIEASSISKELLKQVNDFLNNLGIKCAIYKRKKKEWRWSPQYRIQSNGRKNLKLFVKKIDFINPKHKEKLKKYLSASGES